MILSFHPCFAGDVNMLCAGREPAEKELAAIRAADAVILPQGCRQSLYRMARDHCAHVFPNYDAKFDYPRKIGQLRLFQDCGVPHPRTETYPAAAHYFEHYGQRIRTPSVGFPFIFKFDWGGDGDNVFLIRSAQELRNAIRKATEFERTGQYGFLIQEYIPTARRSLRVVVVGEKYISYWRTQEDMDSFCINIARGGRVDPRTDPELRDRAVTDLRAFCVQTGINLAGFDFLFSTADAQQTPLFLEINYFFGRHGLGGSERYYTLLTDEIRNWLDRLKG
ncbi:hypothetical protein DENIS_3984 [Desulfonema ishimotonii]|uniref:ATP-grasp domain-containing protein n=1 Tax=Desulfonema ishimotonii TaxID=45657 RepID=A0A401G1A5_9BACT|nr:glutathione synthase [Desulfonema ishimotonii]GBC62995.1 hypothetical protein DENIS_3984 [Desulfonema ishimotonii]